jgi:uncharacterized protein YcbX
MQAAVAWISLAPVKGLGLVHPEAVELGEGGVAANRAFYLVDRRGQMVNGKRLGALVTVVPAYDPALGTLSLTFPDGAVVGGRVRTGEKVTTSFFGRPVSGRVVEGPWSEALSTHFEQPLVLVKVEQAGDGVDRGRKAAVSLLSTASLDRLAAALGVSGRRLDHRRFRMLFGVRGVAAHTEDTWLGRQVRLGNAVVAVRGLVGRCLVTGQDPGTGAADMDTLGALRSYRRQPEAGEKLPFGVWGEVVRPGRVALDDTVGPI